MAESGYGLVGPGMGKVKSINQYRLTPGFGGFTPVSYETMEFRLPCRWRGIKKESPPMTGGNSVLIKIIMLVCFLRAIPGTN
ncbi:hypothetical protein V8X58_002102 [Escherichia coli]|nr:hypothetical protein [Escherichia coli]EHC2257202.1 hypothetical protein [Escherichia coli]HCT6879309.1 hypothetical protein [Escherichia coli]